MSKIKFFKESQAIKSLRDTDFDAVSAYGEAIDNSIQAGAARVAIQFVTKEHRKRQVVTKLAFGDDGEGMSPETLHQCLTIGWSSRYNDRTGIGRFGVGMTLGAIHECKRVEVYSKRAEGDWMYTYMDLDEIESGKVENVPKPVPLALPKEFRGLVGESHGTLLLWSKYDRKTPPFDKLVEQFRVWAGRTYRYHLWKAIAPRVTPLVLEIQGEQVKAIDPLYLRTEGTAFPNDPIAEEFEPIILEWAADPDQGGAEGRKERVTIRFTILPEEFRRKKGRGASPENQKRHIPDNEGISILRSHREVFYGDIPYWKSAGGNWPAFDDIDRWWGCEIHFEPALDRAFSVKNIKRGAVPERELKEVIKSRITGTRKEVLRRVRELWDATAQQERLEEEREKNEGVVRPGPDHSTAEAVAKKTPTGKTVADKDKDRDQEADRAAEAMGDAYSEDERQKLAEIFKSQPFTLQNDSWKGDDFFDTQQLGGSAVLKYNEKHRFVEHLNRLLGRLGALEESPQAIEVANELRVMIDLLVMSFARAEQQVDLDEGEVHPEITLENLNGDWGRFLNSFMRTFLDERDVEEGQ